MKLYVCIIESYTELRTIVSAGVLAVLLLACAGMAAGATWVVDDSGGADFTSIQVAVGEASVGDTIEVRSGTYVENVNVNKRLTLIGDGADVVTVRAEDVSDHVFEVTADYVNITGFTVTGTTYESGIYLVAGHCQISDNNASDNYGGIRLYASSNNTLTNNTMSGNTYNFGVYGYTLSEYIQNIDTSNKVDGAPVYYWVDRHDQQIPDGAGFVGVVDSTNITVRDLTLTNNLEGVLLAYTEDSRIENVNASNNDWRGIYLYHSSNNTLTGNIANSNVEGIRLSGSSSSNMLTNNNASGNDYGISLYSSSNNTLTNDTVSDNTWDLYIENSESAFRNNTLSGTTISFTYEGDVSLKGVGSPASAPTGWNTIGKFISATNQSAGAWIFLNFSYSGSDLSGLDESSLKVWKHNGTTWVEDGWNGTRYLDTGDDVVGVNITTFSVFAPAALALAAAGINCTGDVCVNQTGWWRDGGAFNASGTPVQAAIDSATDGDIICVWNGSYSENVDVSKRLTLIGDGADVVTLTAADAGVDVFNVTADYVNISGFTVIGGQSGIHLFYAGHCNISDNIASGNYCGMELYNSSNNTLTNNTASNNDYGISLYSSSKNMLTNNTVSDNAWNDLYIGNSESAFSNNTLNGTTISFTYEGDVSLKGVGSPASAPTGWNTIGKFISATNQSVGAWIFLNFSYSGSDLSGLDESSLKVWKHNGTTWVEDGWNGTRYLDTGDDVVGVNITTFSVFAPAALAAAAYIPPDPAGLANTTGRYWVNYTWFAGTGTGNRNVTDSYNVSMNETWTNGTTDTFRNVSVGPGGWANITVFAYNASGTGTLSVGNISDNVQAPGEPSAPPGINCTCGNICVNQTGWWRDGGAFNASGTPIQAAIDSATDGDTICVWNGSYNENVDVNKRLTIRSENGSANCIVNASDSNDHVFEITAHCVNISGFTIKNATGSDKAGIYLHGMDYNISYNNITNNSEGVHLAPNASDNVINSNNIAGNTLYGINNTNVTETVNATYNWWDDVSGPSGAGNGTGDAISAYVDYDPWLDSPCPGGEAIYFTNATETTVNGTIEIDARDVADTNVTISTTAPVNVTIGNYSRNPGAVFDGEIGKYIDVHVNDTTNVSWIEIKLYYTDDEITDLYGDTLKMYWWNGSAWMNCSDSGVSTIDVGNYSGYIWANTSNATPSLHEFDGLPLTAGGRKRPRPLAPRSRSAGIYPSSTSTPTLAPSPLATPTPGPSPTQTPTLAPSPLATPTPGPSPTQTSSFPTNPLSAVPSKIIAAILASVILIAAVYVVLRRKAK